MSLKDIVVHLDRRGGCTGRLLAAINLARRHGACLKGLCVVSHPYYAPQTDIERDYGEAYSFFVNAASKSGVTAEWLHVDWGVVGIPASDIIIHHSYTADLIIIGQPGTGRAAGREARDLPERLVVGCGRPVVVFPTEGTTFQFGTTILVAWKGGRESSRAIHDAFPLLKAATRIDIVAVVSGEEERAREQAALAVLDVHLARHGIEARQTVVDRGKRSVADTLLQLAADKGSDLLVMGGCTADWRGAPALNPLGREMMARMTVPVLFSH
jgi:nucleotide-binding universal stress UspA family protein